MGKLYTKQDIVREPWSGTGVGKAETTYCGLGF